MKRLLCWFLMHKWTPMSKRDIDIIFHAHGICCMVRCARCGEIR